MHFLFPVYAAKCSGVRPSSPTTFGHDIRIGAQLEEDLRRDLVAIVHGPMQRRVAHAVALVDLRLRSAKNVQQSPVVGRVRDGV